MSDGEPHGSALRSESIAAADMAVVEAAAEAYQHYDVYRWAVKTAEAILDERWGPRWPAGAASWVVDLARSREAAGIRPQEAERECRRCGTAYKPWTDGRMGGRLGPGYYCTDACYEADVPGALQQPGRSGRPDRSQWSRVEAVRIVEEAARQLGRPPTLRDMHPYGREIRAALGGREAWARAARRGLRAARADRQHQTG